MKAEQTQKNYILHCTYRGVAATILVDGTPPIYPGLLQLVQPIHGSYLP